MTRTFIRFGGLLARLLAVWCIAAAGLLVYLGRPFQPDLCEYGKPCGGYVPQTVTQASLLDRVEHLTLGYAPFALGMFVLLAAVKALLNRRAFEVSEDWAALVPRRFAGHVTPGFPFGTGSEPSPNAEDSRDVGSVAYGRSWRPKRTRATETAFEAMTVSTWPPAPTRWSTRTKVVTAGALVVMGALLLGACWLTTPRWGTSALVERRIPLPPCGSYGGVGEDHVDVAAVNGCLLTALAHGRPAEVRVEEREANDSERIRRYFRVLGPASVEELVERRRPSGKVFAVALHCAGLGADSGELTLEYC